ncbi:hypothetical protein G6F62_003853 [Rhizopus arrhizus]|uniref:Uncharacterized protein n=1 Tax=Rhizopus oryzae TaxID=64495 RepID=A0A9P6XH21_RHIOR|nr:hypothetical protein G6F23_009741 [Rhizopus arrhizus]KAG0760883.1 hypothetical protein G6F24_007978 [Rhizopus arrhizus]KAG0783530.1 hypothetical protein G6F22_008648 [Rhizopus arrhizus]KAG0792901.1 hypothetical protein G6F21_004015 [Rhizopus arrhizus]KAG0814006.1 hypothetical protein G6F20_005114 [Rhizopus arrhizus]
MPDPFETEENRIQKKQTKKRKIKKNKQQPVKTKKKDELQVNKQGNNIKKESKEQDNKIPEQVKRIVEEEEEEDQWINVQKKKNQYFVTPEKKLTINKDNSHHLIISPDTTPHQSEDETSNIRRKGWYSPFSTGLDLDILPKFTMDPLCQYKINFTPPSSPLIPNLLEKNQHQQPSSPKQSRIELLENHPFISTTHSHHQHNTLGPIGEKPKYSLK